MLDSFSFASVAPCRHGSADDDPPVSPKHVSTLNRTSELLNSTPISRIPSLIETFRNDPTLQSPSTPAPDLVLASVETDDGLETGPDTDDHEERVAAALMDIRRQRRQQHTRFQSNPSNSPRIHNLARDVSSTHAHPSTTCTSLEAPPLLARDEPGPKKCLDEGDRPISPDPYDNGESVDGDEGFDEGNPLNDPAWTETTVALWKIKAQAKLRRQGHYEPAGASQPLKFARVIKNRPRMRRRRREPSQPAEPQLPVETATSTSNEGTAS